MNAVEVPVSVTSSSHYSRSESSPRSALSRAVREVVNLGRGAGLLTIDQVAR